MSEFIVVPQGTGPLWIRKSLVNFVAVHRNKRDQVLDRVEKTLVQYRRFLQDIYETRSVYKTVVSNEVVIFGKSNLESHVTFKDDPQGRREFRQFLRYLRTELGAVEPPRES